MRLPVAFELSPFEVCNIVPSYAAVRDRRDAMPGVLRMTKCCCPIPQDLIGSHIVAPAHAVVLRTEVYYQVFKKGRGIIVSNRYL